ncbi:hypothetical protein FQR65_LT15306 [Abscondita terminalis]|nr:hypothetical protein FQR65_LT15306 [Abscondita terminalis]
MLKFILSFISFIVLISFAQGKLEVVNDEELLNLIRSEKYVVVLFSKQGKLYRYQIHKYDIASFVSFAQDWYKNVKGEKIPLPKAPFDDFTALIADYLRQNPWLWQLGAATFVLGLIAALIVKLKSKKKIEKKAK